MNLDTFFTVHMQKAIITLGNFTIDRIAQPKSKTDFRTQICTFLELKKLSLSCIYYSTKAASNSYPAVSMTWYDTFLIACICIDHASRPKSAGEFQQLVSRYI